MRTLPALRDAVRAGRRTGALAVLVLLLLPIPFLLVAHQLHMRGVSGFESFRWSVNRDRSYIEVLGYVQVVAAAALLLLQGWWRRLGAVYVAWALVLLLVFVDDATGLHEAGGHWLRERPDAPRPLGLKPQDVGELMVWGGLAVLVLALLWVTHRRSPAAARRDSLVLLALFAVLSAFGAGVDMVHSLVKSMIASRQADVLVGFVEAAGEVGGMTLLLAYVVHVVRRSTARTAEPAAREREPV